MKKILLVFLLLSSPVLAQSNMMRSNVPTMRTLSVNRIPGTNLQGLQYSTTECGLPQQMLGKHVEELRNMRFSQPVRVLQPGQYKTGDFNPKRLNFGIDNRGVILAISCG